MSNQPLPLAAAQARLRHPGRPLKSSAPTEVAERAAQVAGCLPPRLLDRTQAAAYLGISIWSLIDLEAAGHLARVRIGDLRCVRYDRADLDRLIEASK